MKTFIVTAALLAGISVLFSCEDQAYEASFSESNEMSIPFEADFEATLIPENSTICQGNGCGNGTCFKDLKCYLVRCSNPASGICEFTPESYLLDASGDKLFISGHALSPSPPNNSAEVQSWTSDFTFNGGTGRFDGVTGGGNWEGCFRKMSASGIDICFTSSMIGNITIPNAKLKEFTDTDQKSLLW